MYMAHVHRIQAQTDMSATCRHLGVRNSNPLQTTWKAGRILHKVGAFVSVMTQDYKEPSLILTSLQILCVRTIFSSKMPYK